MPLPSHKRGRKPGPVWNFFKLDDEKKHAICNACGTQRCKNVVTLENHLAACSKMTDEASAEWQAVLDDRKKAPATKRRKTSMNSLLFFLFWTLPVHFNVSRVFWSCSGNTVPDGCMSGLGSVSVDHGRGTLFQPQHACCILLDICIA